MSTTQLVELSIDHSIDGTHSCRTVVVEIILEITSTAHPTGLQSEHGANTLEAAQAVGVGVRDEGVSDRGVILIGSYRGESSKKRVENLRSAQGTPSTLS